MSTVLTNNFRCFSLCFSPTFLPRFPPGAAPGSALTRHSARQSISNAIYNYVFSVAGRYDFKIGATVPGVPERSRRKTLKLYRLLISVSRRTLRGTLRDILRPKHYACETKENIDGAKFYISGAKNVRNHFTIFSDGLSCRSSIETRSHSCSIR